MQVYKNPEDGTIDFEQVRMRFCNFAGAPSKFNAEGARNFKIVIDDSEIAQMLLADGYNVKIRPPRDPDDRPSYEMKVNVKISNNRRRDPLIELVVGRAHTRLVGYPLSEAGMHGDDVARLDEENIMYSDLTIRGWEYEEGKRSAYLVELHANVKPSRWARKYAEEECPGDDEKEYVPF